MNRVNMRDIQMKDYDTMLIRWLNTPVEVERTDTLKDHDSVT